MHTVLSSSRLRGVGGFCLSTCWDTPPLSGPGLPPLGPGDPSTSPQGMGLETPPARPPNLPPGYGLLLLTNYVCKGYVFTSVYLFTVGVVSQHALQVSRGYPIMPCRSPGPHPGGNLRGLAWGVSRSTPRWRGSPGPHPGVVLQVPIQGGVSRPTPRGTGVSQHALTPPPPADGYCCGRYASYWNAFLFKKFNGLFTRNGGKDQNKKSLSCSLFST